MLPFDGRLRLYALTTMILLTAIIVGGCNLSSAPEQQLELTDVPTSTVLPTRTLVGDSNAPTPITVTALAVTPTNQLPGTSVSFPPTVIPFPTSTPMPINILIYSPVPGNVVAGSVQILGAASHPQFLQYQLEYGPDPNPGNAWFAATGISHVPVFNGQLGVWNTTVIPDGVYQLRLRVVLRDGTSLATVVNQIRVQNRAPTPVPTNTTIPRPIAAFTQDRVSGQAPLVVRFFNQSSGNITSHSWEFGDGSTSPEVSPVHTFRTPGVYTVRLRVRGPGGAANVSRQITVQSGTPPVAGFTQNHTSGPSPLTVQFTDGSIGNITSRLWDFGDGETSTAVSPSHTFTEVGTYNTILTVYGPGGSSSVRRQITVENPTIPEPIAALVASPTEGQAPLIVQLDASDSSGQIDTYNWDFGDGETGQGQIVSHVYTNEGTYEVGLVVVGPGGQSSRTTTITVIRPPDAPVAAFTSSPESGTVPVTVQFDATASSGDISSYNWDFGDGEAGQGATVSHTYDEAGTFTVALTVTGPGGNSTVTAEISAVPPLEPPSADFTVSPEAGPAPLEVQFNNQSSGDDLTFTWDFGDGNTSQETDPVHVYEVAGEYTVILTVAGPSESDTAQRTISVTETEAPPVASFSAVPASGPAPLEVQFVNETLGDNLTFAWDFGDGSPASSDRDPVHTYTGAGNYIARLTATGPGGEGSTENMIIVSEEVVIAPPIAQFTALPPSGEAPLTVQFSAVESENITEYQWDFGDQAGTALGVNTSYTYSNAGDYTVTLTVTGPGGSSSAQTVISVAAPVPDAPTAHLSANPTNGEAPLMVQFDASGSTGQIDTYTWDFGDQVGFANGATSEYTYSNAGDYTVTLTVTGPGGSNSAQTVISVAAPVPDAPTAHLSANPTNGEAPLTVQFDASGSTGQIDTYTWDFGDQAGTALGVNTSYTYSNAGDYTVTLTVTGPGGSSSAQTVISVAAPVPDAPTAHLSANPTNGEAPLMVQFDASGSTGQIDTYTWDFGDQVGFANGATSEYTYSNAGDYTVTLTVTGPGGSNSAQTVVSVSEPAAPEPPEDGLVSQTPIIPDFQPQAVRDALRNLYVNGVNQGKRASVFAIIGDDLALQSGYLAPLADPNLNNDGSGLQEIVNWYKNTDVGNGRTSFERRSAASGEGWRAQDFLDPSTSGGNCNPGETPIECELRLIQPSVALVSLGAADIANSTDPMVFRGQMEQILQVLVSNGVIPVVSTTQPNPNNAQQTNAINTAIIEAVQNVKAANNTEILIYNQWLAFTNLPNNGLADNNVSPSIAPSGAGNLNDTPASRFGMNARNRDTMVILDELRNFTFPDATPAP